MSMKIFGEETRDGQSEDRSPSLYGAQAKSHRYLQHKFLKDNKMVLEHVFSAYTLPCSS